MDLGATICRPRAPDCGACPLSSDCAAYASGEPERFPAPKRKAVRPVRHGIAYWIERNGCVWLVRRPAKGMLGGMAALPGPEWTDEPECALRRCSATSRTCSRISGSSWTSLPVPSTIWRRLVAADRWAGRGRAADPLQAGGRSRCSLRGAHLRPEPFFSGPGIDRADQVRVDPARLAEMLAGGARQLGLARRSSGSRAGRPARMGGGDLARPVPRASGRRAARLGRRPAAHQCAGGVRHDRFARAGRSAAVRGRAEPRLVAFAASLLRQLRRFHRHRARRLVAGLPANARPSISRAWTRW